MQLIDPSLSENPVWINSLSLLTESDELYLVVDICQILLDWTWVTRPWWNIIDEDDLKSTEDRFVYRCKKRDSSVACLRELSEYLPAVCNMTRRSNDRDLRENFYNSQHSRSVLLQAGGRIVKAETGVGGKIATRVRVKLLENLQ